MSICTEDTEGPACVAQVRGRGQPKPPGPASQDGGVELLDLVPQPPSFLLHLAALLLQLGDVLHRLLQGDGVAGLQAGGGVRAASMPQDQGSSPNAPRQLTSLELLEIKLFRVSKPILMLKRLFCSAEMCFICRFCWGIGPSLTWGTLQAAFPPSQPAADCWGKAGPCGQARELSGRRSDRKLKGSNRSQEGTGQGSRKPSLKHGA